MIIILVFILSCSTDSEKQQRSMLPPQDTTGQNKKESFDLQVRKWEDPTRQAWQDPKFVIEALGDLNDKTIADIGSGTGYFTFQLAVSARKVIAIDIEQRFLNYIEDRKSEMYDRTLAEKIETRLTTPTTPSLNAEEVDVVLLVNTIGYISNRSEYLHDVKNGMIPSGRLVIVDYKEGRMPVGPDEGNKVSEKEVRNSLQMAGFIVDSIDTKSLQYQYLVKAHKPD